MSMINVILRCINVLGMILIFTTVVIFVLRELGVHHMFGYPIYFWFGYKLAGWYPIIKR